MATLSMPSLEAQVLCELVKTASPSAQWAWRPPGGHFMAFGVVCDPPRRGLVVELYCSPGQRVQQPKMNLGLWDRSDGDVRRVYQLTVALPGVPTHTDEKGNIWLGSHEHMGASAIQTSHLDGKPFAAALSHFLQRISLTLEDPIDDPFTGSLR